MQPLLRSCSSLALALLIPSAAAGTLYVDADLTTGLGDGASWADAYQGPSGLWLALLDAVAGDQVFVAQGTYLPGGSSRLVSFQLPDGVEIYGSFLGGEASPSERPPFGTADSVLSGDLAGNDGSGMFGENSFHVLRAFGGPTSVLDGFVIRGGNADGANNDGGAGLYCVDGDLTVRSCRFVGNQADNWGAGALVVDGTVSFQDCTFEDNSANTGAGLAAIGGEVTIDRCAFERNDGFGLLGASASTCSVSNTLIAHNTGYFRGGASLEGGGHHVSNCTVVGNRAEFPTGTGGLYAGDSVVVNGIFWDNDTPAHQLTGIVTYSIVEGGHSGTGNTARLPKFRDYEGGDYSLTLASPGIDAGNNAEVPPGAALDLASNPRFLDEPWIADGGRGTAPIVDMGAFEFQGAEFLGTTYCSPAVPNSTGASGVMKVTGSDVVADDDVLLVALDLPTAPNIGYFLMGTGTNTFTPPGSAGPICVAPGIRRYLPPVNNTAERPGAFSRVVGTAGPISGNITAGSTWNFQAWHRDAAAGTSNLTDAVSVDFQ